MTDFLDTFLNAYGWAWMLVGIVLAGILRITWLVIIDLEA